RVQTRQIPAGLCRQPVVIGPGLSEALAQMPVDGDIGFGYRFATAFAPAAIVLSVIAPRDISRFQHGVFDEDEILIRRQRSFPPRAASAHWCRSGKRDRSRA